MAGGQQQKIFAQVAQVLGALRAAILANDLAEVQRHTSTITELLVQLRPLLDSQYVARKEDPRSLGVLARNVLVLLQKSRRTVCALSGVYRFALGSDDGAVLEPR